MTVTTARGGYLDRPRSSGLADVIDIILDKGLVIDAFVRVSVLGLELITIDARIVVASVDTYLRFAEATDRLYLEPASTTGVPELFGGAMQSGAKQKVKGAAEGAKEKLGIGSDSGNGQPEQQSAERERG